MFFFRLLAAARHAVIGYDVVGGFNQLPLNSQLQLKSIAFIFNDMTEIR